MASIPTKVRDRLAAGIKRFQPVLSSAKSRDVNESDTVTIVTDLLADVFGFDKYSEITSEYAIRGTFVDLAIKLDGHPQMLIEVKAIGLDMKDSHAKQAVDYAANLGVDWVVLTNGVDWHVYRVKFSKPIEQELILEFNFLDLNPKNTEDCDRLHLLTKEGLEKSLLGIYHAQRQVLSRYFIGAVLLTDTILDVVRRELRRLAPDVKVDTDQIREVLVQDALKREIVEGEKAEEARRKIARCATRVLRKPGKEEKEEAEIDAPELGTEAPAQNAKKADAPVDDREGSQ